MITVSQKLVPFDGETRERQALKYLVIHRIEVSQEDPSFLDTPQEVARFFAEHPTGKQATGGKMPYPILVNADGEISQTVPLRFVCPHVRAYNPQSIGIGVIGDFRDRACTPPQRDALLKLCSELLTRFNLQTSALVGHDELSGASQDPDKICPGDGLSPKKLRHDLEQETYTPIQGIVW